MIYFIYGNEYEKARLKARELTESLQKKRPDAVFFRISSLDYAEHSLADLVAGQGLFESKYVVFFDNLFEAKEIKEEVIRNLKDIAGSENVFIFLEKELDKKTLDVVEKHAQKVQLIEQLKEKKKSEYNPFALSDAFVARDKKRLWMLLIEAKGRGSVAEEVHGMLWWQVKSMALVAQARDAAEAGISPFVFTKTKSALKSYSESEIKGMLFRLASMYHDAHRGIIDFWNEMERWVLEI